MQQIKKWIEQQAITQECGVNVSVKEWARRGIDACNRLYERGLFKGKEEDYRDLARSYLDYALQDSFDWSATVQDFSKAGLISSKESDAALVRNVAATIRSGDTVGYRDGPNGKTRVLVGCTYFCCEGRVAEEIKKTIDSAAGQ